MPTITKVYPIYTVCGWKESLVNFVENNLYCLHHDQDYILNKWYHQANRVFQRRRREQDVLAKEETGELTSQDV